MFYVWLWLSVISCSRFMRKPSPIRMANTPSGFVRDRSTNTVSPSDSVPSIESPVTRMATKSFE